MKTLLIFLAILFFSLSLFSQNQLTKDETLQLEQIQNYNEYVKFCNDHKLTPKTEADWIYNVTYLADYRLKQEIQEIKSTLNTSGLYLIKARNHIIEGIGCGILSGSCAFIGSTVYKNAVSEAQEITNQYEREDRLNIAKQSNNIFNIGTGILALAGISLEISGIIQIGNAGISLNDNGVGIEFKF